MCTRYTNTNLAAHYTTDKPYSSGQTQPGWGDPPRGRHARQGGPEQPPAAMERRAGGRREGGGRRQRGGARAAGRLATAVGFRRRRRGRWQRGWRRGSCRRWRGEGGGREAGGRALPTCSDGHGIIGRRGWKGGEEEGSAAAAIAGLAAVEAAVVMGVSVGDADGVRGAMPGAVRATQGLGWRGGALRTTAKQAPCGCRRFQAPGGRREARARPSLGDRPSYAERARHGVKNARRQHAEGLEARAGGVRVSVGGGWVEFGYAAPPRSCGRACVYRMGCGGRGAHLGGRIVEN